MRLRDKILMRKLAFLPLILTSFGLPVFAQTQLIQDGDFESPTVSAWNISTGAGIKANPAAAHGGNNYLSLGNNSQQIQLVFQTITIPTNTVAASLTFFVNVITQSPSV